MQFILILLVMEKDELIMQVTEAPAVTTENAPIHFPSGT